MKKNMIRASAALLAAVMAVSVMASCGEKEKKKKKHGSFDLREYITEQRDSFPYSVGVKHFDQDNEKKPEIDRIDFIGIGKRTSLDKVMILDYYETDYMTSSANVLVGAPYYLDLPEDIISPVIRIHYNEDELRWVEEDDLALFTYTEEEGFSESPDYTFDKDNDTFMFVPEESCEFFLIDKAEWLRIWAEGGPVENDRRDYVSDWERECDTGSIMEIADIDWARENAPYFEVSTPEQLAGVVYYANTYNGNAPQTNAVYIELKNDIDLKGLEWAPMGWGGPQSIMITGEINGNGHTIRNMRLTYPTPSNDNGFVGFGWDLYVHDISFEDAVVIGGTNVGIVAGSITGGGLFERVNATGTIETDSEECGSLLGWDAWVDFLECTSDVTVNGEDYPYFSYQEMLIANTEVVEYFKIEQEDGYVFTAEPTGDLSGMGNVMWEVKCDGKSLLNGGPSGRLDLFETVDKIPGGEYSVCLLGFTDKTYIRVSNVIEFTYEPER